MRQIDHIVYTVPNLEKAIDWFAEISGIRPAFGGYHTTQGTKNAVVNLGNSCYLELLAADDANKDIQSLIDLNIQYAECINEKLQSHKDLLFDIEENKLEQQRLDMTVAMTNKRIEESINDQGTRREGERHKTR